MNTGCFDPLPAIAEICKRHDAWLHVDGAVGLWAASSPEFDSLTEGLDRADSWSTDAHKWLNVTYDCGFIAVKDKDSLQDAMGISAPYLKAAADARDSYQYVPESSRRARGFILYAALRSLGRKGVADLVERCSFLARLMAAELEQDPAIEVINEVVINQALVAVTGDESGELTADAVGAHPAGRDLLAGGDALARPAGDPHLGLQLADERGRHPALRRGHPEGCARGLGALMADSGTQAVLFDIDGTLISDRRRQRSRLEARLQGAAGSGRRRAGGDREGRSRPGGRQGGLREGDRPRAHQGRGGGTDAAAARPPARGGGELARVRGQRWGRRAAREAPRRTGFCSVSPLATSRRPPRSSWLSADLNRYFSFGGYGSDSPDRTELTEKALERARSSRGRASISPYLSCGDTPRDVDGGHGAGIRVVCVATGEYTAEDLVAAGADAVIHSLVEGLPLL